MTKARNLSDLLDATGDIKSDALDNVPPSNDASALTTGTIDNARISLDANEIPNLDTSKITTGTLSADRIDNNSLANVTALPAAITTGKVLQVVHAHTATIANSSSTSYADTGLTASITPSATSSKVIVIINQSVAKMGGANSYGNFRVYRDSTEIGGAIPARALGSTNDTGEIYLGMPFNYNFQDSPSSTSSVTYKTQFNNGAGTGTIRCQPDSSQSYILLMEVAG